MNNDFLINKKIGKLLVLEYIGHSSYKCLCDCGNYTIQPKYRLKNNIIKSCGCYKKQRLGIEKTKHGLYNSIQYKRLRKNWKNMLDRCYNNKSKKYNIYGFRGIKVCEEWKNDFMSFYNWAISNGYNIKNRQKEQSLDRIDVNGNYEPNNCRFVSAKEQARNTRKNIYITYNDETHCIAEWAEILKISPSTIRIRYKANLPLNLVLSKQKLRYGTCTFKQHYITN